MKMYFTAGGMATGMAAIVLLAKGMGLSSALEFALKVATAWGLLFL